MKVYVVGAVRSLVLPAVIHGLLSLDRGPLSGEIGGLS